MAIIADEVSDDEPPHRAFGTGKIIRAGKYGHVNVTAVPKADSAAITVEWHVLGQSIPDDQREPILRAARQMLMASAADGNLRCGVLLIIEDGSFHEAATSAHVEAAELAIGDALRRGLFTREA